MLLADTMRRALITFRSLITVSNWQWYMMSPLCVALNNPGISQLTSETFTCQQSDRHKLIYVEVVLCGKHCLLWSVAVWSSVILKWTCLFIIPLFCLAGKTFTACNGRTSCVQVYRQYKTERKCVWLVAWYLQITDWHEGRSCVFVGVKVSVQFGR